jgi:hypothetical protein
MSFGARALELEVPLSRVLDSPKSLRLYQLEDVLELLLRMLASRTASPGQIEHGA